MTTGAYIASAALKAPKRKGPPAPKRARASPHNASMRSMFARTASFMPLPGCAARMFIGMWLRRSRKPECISAAIERAKARAASSRGHTPICGCHSLSVSMMASESHTDCSARHSTGTRRDGDQRAMPASHSLERKRSLFSSKPMPSSFMRTQGRIDHEEQFLLPITSVKPAMSSPSRVGAESLVARAAAAGAREILGSDRLERRGLEAEHLGKGPRAHIVHAHRAQVVAREELARQVLEDYRLQRRDSRRQRDDAPRMAEGRRHEAHQLLQRVGARPAQLVGRSERARLPQGADQRPPHLFAPHALDPPTAARHRAHATHPP